MRELFSAKAAVVHRYAWLLETLETEPTLFVRPMFGGKAVYLHGRLVLSLNAHEEPWRGVLVATSQEHHASLVAERPALRVHPILGKWLYLPEACATFERDATWLVARIRACDPRIGVEPGKKIRKSRSRPTQSRKRG
jgi:hypothetical protein